MLSECLVQVLHLLLTSDFSTRMLFVSGAPGSAESFLRFCFYSENQNQKRLIQPCISAGVPHQTERGQSGVKG